MVTRSMQDVHQQLRLLPSVPSGYKSRCTAIADRTKPVQFVRTSSVVGVRERSGTVRWAHDGLGEASTAR